MIAIITFRANWTFVLTLTLLFLCVIEKYLCCWLLLLLWLMRSRGWRQNPVCVSPGGFYRSHGSPVVHSLSHYSIPGILSGGRIRRRTWASPTQDRRLCSETPPSPAGRRPMRGGAGGGGWKPWPPSPPPPFTHQFHITDSHERLLGVSWNHGTAWINKPLRTFSHKLHLLSLPYKGDEEIDREPLLQFTLHLLPIAATVPRHSTAYTHIADKNLDIGIGGQG